MSDLPTVDEAFGLPDVDSIFPKSPLPSNLTGGGQWTMDGQHFDEEFMQGGAGKILDYFGTGFKQGWGQRPLGDFAEKSWVKDARELGLFNDIDKHEKNWVKQFNESLLRGTAGALDFAMRAPLGLYYGAANVGVEAGLLPRDVAALPEAFPMGRFTGLPARPSVSLRTLEQARELEVIGQSNDKIAREAFAPQGVERPTERVVEQATPVDETPTPPQATDVHAQARLIAPDTFKEYDALAEQKQEMWDFLQEQKTIRDAPVQARIDEILGKVNNVEERLTKRASLRLELARKELEEIQSVDTPAMAQARKSLQEVDYKMRDLAPDVSEAYREAQRQMPEEARLSTEVIPLPTNIDQVLQNQGWMREAVAQMSESEKELAAQQGFQEAQVQNLAQRRLSITQDLSNRLIALGRPEEEARATAALIQAHFEARAARFKGALGSARDLYEKEAPAVFSGSHINRGSINIATNTIRLFEKADAATYMHESAHSWLEELKRDSGHDLAPPDLKADFQTVKDWVGAEGDNFTRRQHEKFARGFERYLMEGQAPSSRLASVFEKFKDWLTQIYKTVSRLRAPITDDIRGVYDRLLAAPNKEPVIAPERPGAVDFATHAEETARATPASQAAEVAGNVLAEREKVAQLISKVVDDARRDARRGTQRIQLPEREGAGGEPATPGANVVTADDAFDRRRNPPTGKSAAPRRADQPFGPADTALVDRAGNIRVDNLNAPDDVGAAIRQAADESGGFVEARRGVLSDAEVLKLADDLGMSPNKLDRRRIGEAFNAEEIVQARRLLVHSATQVRDAMGRAATGDEAGIIEYAIARERHLMIQEQVAGVTAEAGRALRAFRAIEGMQDAKGLADFFQRNLRMTPEALQREAQMGLRLNDPARVSRFVRESSAPGWQHMPVEAWMSSLLSGPMTHVRNIIGNVSVALNSVVETGLAAGVSRTLRHENGVSFQETGDRLWGMGQGSVDGIRAFGRAIVDETYALEREAHTDDRAFRRAIPDVNIAGVNIPLGQGIRMPMRFLAAEDEFFKALAFRQELNVLARRSARLEGLEGLALDTRIAELVNDPTEEMLVGASKHAQYQTFTNQLGAKGRAIQSWADSHPFARFVFPFIRTPTNIVKYAAERTPFGLLSARVRDNIMGRNGEVAQATQLARLALGSTIMTAVGTLAFNDLVSGGGSPRPEQRNNDVQTGKIPYALRIGDSWISYRGIDPISFPLGIAADLAELAKNVEKDDPDYQKAAAMAIVNLAGHGLVERLPLRSLSQAFQAVYDWEQHGPAFINSLAGSVVPGAVAQTAQIIDPVQRDTRSLVDAMMARVGMRSGLMPRRDVWGEPIAQTDVGPVQVSSATADPTRLEVARLGMGLAMPPRKHDGVEMTPQQYDDFVRIRGRFTKEMLDSLIQTPAYQGLTDGVRRQLIHREFEAGSRLAKAQVTMGSMGSDNDLVQKGIEAKLKALK